MGIHNHTERVPPVWHNGEKTPNMFATHHLDTYASQASQYWDLEIDSKIADLYLMHRVRRLRSGIDTTAAKFTSVTPTRFALHWKEILDFELTSCELHETTPSIFEFRVS